MWPLLGVALGLPGAAAVAASPISMGASIFMAARVRDRVAAVFGAPVFGLAGMLALVAGARMLGFGDLPPGYDDYIMPGVGCLFGVGVVLGILTLMASVKGPATLDAALSVMKTCPMCAEQIQKDTIIYRYCRSRLSPESIC
jgi:hypothetical protein